MTWECVLEGVSTSWDDNAVLQEVDLKVDCERLGGIPLMGPSGAGKSTLLYVMASLKWPDAGRVRWRFPDGFEIGWGPEGLDDQAAARLRRELFGFAFQDSTLSAHLTIAENLTYPLLRRQDSPSEVSRKVAAALQANLLAEEDELLRDLMQRFPHQLSGGQRQRAALAQAGIHDPVVLFADEPAGNLDLATRRQVMEVLKQWLHEDYGKRLLMWVTHHTDDPALMGANELIWVDGGRAKLRSHEWLEDWVKGTMGRGEA